MELKLAHVHYCLVVLALVVRLPVSQSMIPGFQTCTAPVAGGGGIGEGGPASAATIGSPSGLWASPGGVYVVDSVLHNVRFINGTTNSVRTVFGSPSGKYSLGITDLLNSPSQIVGDAAGNIYVADTNNQIVRMYANGSSSQWSVVTSSPIGSPTALALLNGTLYIGDGKNGIIYAILPNGTQIIAAGGGGEGFVDGPALSAQFNLQNTAYMCVFAGQLLIADSGNHRIRALLGNGSVVTFAGNGLAVNAGDGGPYTSASVSIASPTCLAANSTHIFFFASNIMRFIAPNGFIFSLGAIGFTPVIMAMDIDSSLLAGASTSIVRITPGPSGSSTNTLMSANTPALAGQSGDGGPATAALLSTPRNVAVCSDGTLLISTSAAVRRIAPNGTMSTAAIITAPDQISVMEPGKDILVADSSTHVIWWVATNGSQWIFAGTASTAGSSGDGGIATSATLNAPQGVAYAGSVVYIGDTAGHRVRAVDLASRVITTVVGTGTPFFNGDGSPASSMMLRAPQCVYWNNGALYIADSGNFRVRKYVPSTDSVVTVAASSSIAPHSLVLPEPNVYWMDTSTICAVMDQFGQVVMTVYNCFSYNGEFAIGASSFNVLRGLGWDSTYGALYAVTHVHRMWVSSHRACDASELVVGTVTATTSSVKALLSFGPWETFPCVYSSINASNPALQARDAGYSFLLQGTYSGMTTNVSCAAVNVSEVRRAVAACHMVVQVICNTVTLDTGSDWSLVVQARRLNGSVMRQYVPTRLPALYPNISNVTVQAIGVSTIQLTMNGTNFGANVLQVINASLQWVFPCVVSVVNTSQATALCNITANSARTYTAPPTVAICIGDLCSTPVTVPSVMFAFVAGTTRLAWGQNITFFFWLPVASQAANVTFYTSAGSIPCGSVVQVNTTTITCQVTGLWEVGFVSRLGVRVSFFDGAIFNIPPSTANITFVRPALTSFAPLVVSSGGGTTITAVFAQPIPSWPSCASTSPRMWLGTARPLPCNQTNATSVRCATPAGTATYVQLTIEVCGLFNATSDGRMPLSAPQIATVGPSAYASYDPSSYFAAALASAAPQVLARPSNNITIVGTGLLTIASLIGSVSVAGGVCATTVVAGNTSLICVDWAYDPSAGNPRSFASVNLTWMMTFRGQMVAMVPTVKAIHAPQLVSVSPLVAAPGNMVQLTGAFLVTSSGAAVSVNVSGVRLVPKFVTNTTATVQLPSLLPSSWAALQTLNCTITTTAGTSTDSVNITLASLTIMNNNVSFRLGENVTLVYAPPVPLAIQQVSVFSAFTSAPCSAPFWVDANTVTCRLMVLLEAGFAVSLGVQVVYVDGTATNVSAAAANITFVRPMLVSLTPRVISSAGGGIVSAMLPLDLPAWSICSSAQVRGWFGSVRSLSCTRDTLASISCLAPAGSATHVQLTLEICGSYNITSDGLAPFSTPQPNMLNLNSYLSFDPSARFAAALSAAAPQVLGRAVSSINIAATGLLSIASMIDAVYLSGSVCASCAVLTDTSLMCYGWVYNASAGNPTTAASVTLSISLRFRNETVPLVPLLKAVHAPQLLGVAPSPASAGTRLLLTGAFFIVTAGDAGPSVSVAGIPCPGVGGLTTSTNTLCTLPAVPTTTSGFPFVPVTITTAAGTATDVVTLRIINVVTGTFNLTSDAPLPVLSSSAQALVPLVPAPVITISGDMYATCTIAIASYTCPASVYLPGLPYTADAVDVSLVGVTVATSDVIVYNAAGIRARAGCIINITGQCMDSSDRNFRTAVDYQIVVATFTATWSVASDLSISQLPNATVAAETQATFNWLLWSPGTTTSWWQFVVCTAIIAVDGSFSPDLPLLQIGDRISSASGMLSLVNASTATISFPTLSTNNCEFGRSYYLAAECAWQATGERVRVASRRVSIPAATIEVHTSADHPLLPVSYVQVTGYANTTIFFSVRIASMSTQDMSVQPEQCAWMRLNTSLVTAGFLQYSAQIEASPSNDTIVLSVVTDIQAPPSTTMCFVMSCKMYEQAVSSAAVCMQTATMDIDVLPGLPSEIMPSDNAARAPVPINLRLVVCSGVAPSNTTLRDVTCTLSAGMAVNAQQSAVALLPPAELDSAAFVNVAADTSTGIVSFPPMAVRVPPSQSIVTMRITCQRPNGIGPQPLLLNLPVNPLQMRVCSKPVATAQSQDKFAPFGVAMGDCQHADAVDLPPILCTVGQSNEYNGSQHPDSIPVVTAAMSNVSVFLVGSSMFLVEGRANFNAFSITARPGFIYALSLSCSVGTLVIPSPFLFAVWLDGCPAGSHAGDLLCEKCAATGEFSLGGSSASSCTGCPPAGAVCSDGILSLLPNYYRPQSQVALPLGPDTELHACYNEEACTLNATSTVYGCAEGYTGPLCGVCDEAANYARFGAACRPCWNTAELSGLMAVVVVCILLLLIRAALQSKSQRSDASILFRIALSYIQAIGSLSTLKAGGTKAYHDVMGWSEAVSASPLSSGLFECTLRLPYLAQYVGIIALPVFATISLICVFFLVTAVQSLRCRPQLSWDAPVFLHRLHEWWTAKQHITSFVFVLFVAYMPMTSASLRVLDCLPTPIAGVTYVRSDLNVECGVGQHAVARALAYLVLICIGVGFPLGLGITLYKATPAQLGNPSYHATWGFLFDGYRYPAREAPKRRSTLLGTAAAILTAAIPNEAASVSTAKDSNSKLVWWESIALIRKAGIVLIAVVIRDAYLQCMAAAMWFLIHLLLHLYHLPYVNPRFNRLESFSLGASVFTVIICTALLQYTTRTAELVPSMTSTEWGITIALLLLNLGTITILVGSWLHAQFRKAKGIIARTKTLRITSLSNVGANRGSASAAPETNNPPFSTQKGGWAAENPLVLKRTPPVAHASDTVDGPTGSLPPFSAVEAPNVPDSAFSETAEHGERTQAASRRQATRVSVVPALAFAPSALQQRRPRQVTTLPNKRVSLAAAAKSNGSG